jgi:cardiolipin synthase
VRLALIPVFIVLSYTSPDGRDDLAAVAFAVVGWSDYADGIAARVTGQYSRLGALLDPVIDRLLIISGVVVCWSFSLLPRWAIAVLLARELLMLLAGRAWVRRGFELQVNWLGRLAVWPTMSAVFFALVKLPTVAEVLLYVGVAMAMAASVMYVRTGLAMVRAGSS